MVYATYTRRILILFVMSLNYLVFCRKIQNFLEGEYFIDYIKKSNVDNDITGTGNKLKDTTYNSLCVLLNCPFVCCDGPIDQMKCGDAKSCNDYWNLIIEKKTIKIIIIVILPYLLIPIMWLLAHFIHYKNPDLYNKMIKIINIYLGIVLPPYGIIILIDYLRGSKSEEHNDEISLSHLKIFKNHKILFNDKRFIKVPEEENRNKPMNIVCNIEEFESREVNKKEDNIEIYQSIDLEYNKDNIINPEEINNFVLEKIPEHELSGEEDS
jgi:hypothetical protein